MASVYWGQKTTPDTVELRVTECYEPLCDAENWTQSSAWTTGTFNCQASSTFYSEGLYLSTLKKIILEVPVLRKDKIVQMVQMIEKEVGFEHNRWHI